MEMAEDRKWSESFHQFFSSGFLCEKKLRVKVKKNGRGRVSEGFLVGFVVGVFGVRGDREGKVVGILNGFFFLCVCVCVQAVLLDVCLAFYRMWMKELEGKMVGIG